jgi:hypothetical protein
MYEYIGILLGAHHILHISRIRVKLTLLKIVGRALSITTLDLLVAQGIGGNKGGTEQHEDCHFLYGN